MEYTVSELAKLSGVSARTLRFYDSNGLLHPAMVRKNGYRVYTEKQVDILQQILFFRELGFSLDEIKCAICDSDFDAAAAMQIHLCSLEKERRRITALCETVKKTIEHLKGETAMTDEEKFMGFKEAFIEKNEEKYGAEIRQKYGDRVIDSSNDRIKNMDESTWNNGETLKGKIEKQLVTAFNSGDVTTEEAKKLFDMHKSWLTMYWGPENYSDEAYRILAESYIEDKRFKEYYDGIIKDGARYLHDVIIENCK